jgi:hypothetical protein
MCCFIVTISTSAGIAFHLDLWKIKFTATTINKYIHTFLTVWKINSNLQHWK